MPGVSGLYFVTFSKDVQSAKYRGLLGFGRMRCESLIGATPRGSYVQETDALSISHTTRFLNVHLMKIERPVDALRMPN